jgi:hypothetical protein
MEWRLIFDLQDAGYPWRYPAVGVLLAAVMGLIAMQAARKSELRQYCAVCSSLLLLWTCVLVGRSYPAYTALLEAERQGNVSVVEGAVNQFHKGRGTSKERFCVGGRCFQYIPETVPVSFMNSSLQGGPVIADGLRVRIASAGEAIVRLEILGDHRTAER